ncbi:MAG: hypothetical protein ACK42I_03665, partial [Thermomicrobium sp.]
ADRTYDQALATTTTNISAPLHLPPADAAGPLLEPSPEVVACFEAANARPASPLERTLLAELEREFLPLAASRGESSAELLVAAIREAVASGSRYVAPKRIREILARWSRHSLRTGDPASRAVNPAGSARPSDVPATPHALSLQSLLTSPALDLLVARLEEAIAQRLAIPNRAQDAVVTPDSRMPERPTPSQENFSSPGDLCAPLPESPPPLAAIWSLAQEHLSERVPRSAFAECIRPARLLAAPSPDELVLGVPSDTVRRQLERRWLVAVREILSALMERPVTVRVVPFAEWNAGGSPIER